MTHQTRHPYSTVQINQSMNRSKDRSTHSPWTNQSINQSINQFTYLFHLSQLPTSIVIIPQVLLVTHQNDGHIRTEMPDLQRRIPSCKDQNPTRWKKWGKSSSPQNMFHFFFREIFSIPRESISLGYFPDYRDCRWRSTSKWHRCRDSSTDGVDRSPLGPPCPIRPVPPKRKRVKKTGEENGWKTTGEKQRVKPTGEKNCTVKAHRIDKTTLFFL